MIRYNKERKGSQIWMKSQEAKKLVQEHSFCGICTGETANLWDDVWNQFPKLRYDPRWMDIGIKGREEGRIKVSQYQILWLIQEREEGHISEEDIKAFQAELQEIFIHVNPGSEILRWGYK